MFTGSLWAQDCDANATIAVGNAVGESGFVDVELRGGSLCEVTGFGMAIGHDNTQVEFIDAAMGPFLMNHAGSELFTLVQEHNDDGFMSMFVALDIDAPLTVPPTSIPPDTLLAILTYRILPGAAGVVPLRNETRTFGSPSNPIRNIYTSDIISGGISPVLESGMITIGQAEVFRMSLEATGDTEIQVQLQADSSKDLRAYSALLTFDPAVLAVAPGSPTLAEAAFAGTVWEGSLINSVVLGPGTIEVSALRGPTSTVPAGVDLPFLNLTFDVLSCAGSTIIGFAGGEDEDANQLVDSELGIHFAGEEVLVSGVTVSLGGSGSTGFIRGNANGSSIELSDPSDSIDLADALFMLAHLFQGGQAPPCLDAADANDDGRYNLLDPIWVIQFLVGNAGSSLPAPFTQPGEDPTADSLGCANPPGAACEP